MTVIVSDTGKLGTTTKELELAEGVGKPELARDVMVKLASVIVGNPDEGSDETVKFADGNGAAEVGRNVLVMLIDGVGRPEIGREEVLKLPVGLGNPDETEGKPELER